MDLDARTHHRWIAQADHTGNVIFTESKLPVLVSPPISCHEEESNYPPAAGGGMLARPESGKHETMRRKAPRPGHLYSEAPAIPPKPAPPKVPRRPGQRKKRKKPKVAAPTLTRTSASARETAAALTNTVSKFDRELIRKAQHAQKTHRSGVKRALASELKPVIQGVSRGGFNISQVYNAFILAFV